MDFHVLIIINYFNYQPVLSIGNSIIEIESFLEILGVHIDNKLSFKTYVSAILKKVYAKIGALKRLKRLVHPDVALILYKCYILPHLEYCSLLLLGINKPLVNKLEATNYYALKVRLNVGKDVDYNSILSIAGMNSLEFRRYEKSLLLLYKCIKGNGPSYISFFFFSLSSVFHIITYGEVVVTLFSPPTTTSISTILLLIRLLIYGTSYLHMLTVIQFKCIS